MKRLLLSVLLIAGLAACETPPLPDPQICVGGACIDDIPVAWGEPAATDPSTDEDEAIPEADDVPFGAFTPPGAPYLTCYEMKDCMDDCDAQSLIDDCETLCASHANGATVATWNALVTCLDTQCQELSDDDFELCVFYNCAESAGECFLNGKASCAETLVCSTACSEADEPNNCGSGCTQEMSPDAYVDQSEMTTCWTSVCDDQGWLCQLTRLFNCPVEASECGLYGSTGESCVDVVDCVVNCESGSCLLQCLAETTPNTATVTGEYFLCLYDSCGSVPGEGCIDFAKQGVCKEVLLKCIDD